MAFLHVTTNLHIFETACAYKMMQAANFWYRDNFALSQVSQQFLVLANSFSMTNELCSCCDVVPIKPPTTDGTLSLL